MRSEQVAFGDEDALTDSLRPQGTCREQVFSSLLTLPCRSTLSPHAPRVPLEALLPMANWTTSSVEVGRLLDFKDLLHLLSWGSGCPLWLSSESGPAVGPQQMLAELG